MASIRPSSDALLQRVPTQLRKVFRLQRLRPGQHEAISRALRGLNTLAVMPTGAGKSLCFQLPATLLPGITVVVSPLIALMHDQCERLAALGVAAVQLNSALDAQAVDSAEQAIAGGKARVVFVTPERLADPACQALLTRTPIALLVVDEAHCISQWGHDFRPAFTEIGTALPALGSPPVLALTATASEDVMGDIARQLGIPAAGVLTGSSYRPNLQFRVEPVADEAAKLRQAVSLVAASEGPAIVYCTTVKAAETVQAALLEAGIAAALYHGKLRPSQRQDSQEAFMSGQARAMVATNAFGLGIDKPDIRLVLHYQLPAGLDVYYQEAGRAGRDGAPAQCVLLFLASDRAVQQFFLNGRYPSVDDADALAAALATGESWTIAQLKEHLQRPAAKLRVLLNLLRREGHLQLDAEGRITSGRPGHGIAIDPAELRKQVEAYVARSQQDQARLEQMVAYAQTGGCRWRSLLEGFDEPLPFANGRCQCCDNCRRMAEHESRVADITIAAGDECLPQAGQREAGFAEGDTVRVRRYGQGIVLAASTEAITVAFGDGKERRSFHPDYVRRSRRPPRNGEHANGLARA